MHADPAFLRVKGSQIVRGPGEVIRLRGFCLGGWMCMENWAIGFPGHETGQRRALGIVLGRPRTDLFLDCFLHHFVTQEDLRFIKGLGCNVLRVGLNYRHFESDDRPFDYRPAGFALLDQLVAWARDLQLYLILDLHAVQGWQNGGWHCDNPNREAHFWGQKQFEDRAVALWEALARHYRAEPFVAGYNLMNEPDDIDAVGLNHFYRRATAAIRAVDPDHILFLDGNRYAQDFSQLDPPFDDNSVYGYHFYPEPILTAQQYPCEVNGTRYDRAWLEQVILQRSEFMRQHHVPAWAGEFGCLYPAAGGADYCPRLMADLLDLVESHGQHWTIWTYKDIGRMGLVYVRPETAWMQRTRVVRDLKSTLRCDFWVERHPTEIGRLLDQLAAYIESVVATQPGNWSTRRGGDQGEQRGDLRERLYGAVCEYALSQALLPAYAEQFRGIDEAEIDRVMQSFAFGNCSVRTELTNLVTKYTRG